MIRRAVVLAFLGHELNEIHGNPRELPPQVELEDPDLAAATHAAVEAVERG